MDPGFVTNNEPRFCHHLSQNRKQTFEQMKNDSGFGDPGSELGEHQKSAAEDDRFCLVNLMVIQSRIMEPGFGTARSRE